MVRWFAVCLLALVVAAAARASTPVPVACSRADGTIVVRAPAHVRVALVTVGGHRRGRVRRGHPLTVKVPAGRTVTIRVTGETPSGRRVVTLLRVRRCPAPLGPTATPFGPDHVAPSDPRLRYEGRWDVQRDVATTVNSGARLYVRFTGDQLTADFDVSHITAEPQLYVWVDGRRSDVMRINSTRLRLTPSGLADRSHLLVLGVKDVRQEVNHWTSPLNAAVKFLGFELPGGALEDPLPAPALRLTFIGDSITQGIGDRCVVESDGVTSGQPSTNGSDCSDATIDYAWRTARVFGAQLEQVGFGGQGVTQPGGGNVPPAPESVDLNFAGSPAAPFAAQVVVINLGTNDVLHAAAPDAIRSRYLALLRKVRARYPEARILALEIFGAGGAETATATAAIQAAVGDFGDSRTTFVPTRGWLTPVTDFTDSIHPNDSGHRHATEHLAAVITQLTGLLPLAPMDAAP